MDIDAVVNLTDSTCPYSDPLDEPRSKVVADRSVTKNKWIDGFAQQIIFPARTINVIYIAPVLAVDASRHAGQCGHDQVFERGEITAVDDRRTEFSQHPAQAEVTT